MSSYTINGTAVPWPNSVQEQPYPVTPGLSGAPWRRGWRAMTWSWKYLEPAAQAALIALYDRENPLVTITYLDAETNSWKTETAMLEEPNTGVQDVAVWRGTQLTFEHYDEPGTTWPQGATV